MACKTWILKELNLYLRNVWLSRVKYRVRVVFRWFELEARLCPTPGALNVFFEVVMKVWMFIELVSGVKYPKITTVGFVLKRPFVDVSSLCRSFFFFFRFFFNFFCVWNFLVFTLRETCFTFIFRVEKSVWWAGLKALHFKALYLEFFFPPKTPYLTLLSHICFRLGSSLQLRLDPCYFRILTCSI